MSNKKYVNSLSDDQKSVPVIEYHSTLPNLLLNFVDAVIKIDQSSILRHDYIHYSIDELLIDSIPTISFAVWIWVDPFGHQSIISKQPHYLFIQTSHKSLAITNYKKITAQQYSNLKLLGNARLIKILPQKHEQMMQDWDISSIDALRVKCQANVYTSVEQFMRDLKGVIAWNQLYRTASIESFEYLSLLYHQIILLVEKKELPRRFFEVKQKDFDLLLQQEAGLKTEVAVWPYIPTHFRQYTYLVLRSRQIAEYISSPSNRGEIIMERMRSEKQPMECPEECPCLDSSQNSFRYSLASGWETVCPNRVRKMECDHTDQTAVARCRNMEIKKKQRKLCRQTNQQSQHSQQLITNEEGGISQFLAWGVDYYTRNVIFYSLPEFDYDGVQKMCNIEARAVFIEKVLLKAFNFLGTDGYNLAKTCEFIINNAAAKKYKQYPEWRNKSMKQEEQIQLQMEYLFGEKDKHYASLLLQNYLQCKDKSAYRIHTKGKGAKCVDKAGIKEGSFIVQYFGEVYQPWRWYDRQDFIKEIIKKKKSRHYIPQFYNILLQKHPDEPLGLDMLVVDPSRMGNYSSRFSHSCSPNCGTVITVSAGKYYIAMYAFRDIDFGEELTFDYCCTTESKYEHENSICLCGGRNCRGKYLQLENPRKITNAAENCFYLRNSIILNAAGAATQHDYDTCHRNNIKNGFLNNCPQWLIRWMAHNLDHIEKEAEMHKEQVMQQLASYYDHGALELNSDPLLLYADANKQDLINARISNILASVDKIKYCLSRTPQCQPPIVIERYQKIVMVLINAQDSVLKELQECLIEHKFEREARTVQMFMLVMDQHSLPDKLLIFRLCCLVMSHRMLSINASTARFSAGLLSDILYFYAFTHTYFSPTQYQNFEAEEITVSLSEITGEKSQHDKKEKQRKRYNTPFVWGQMVSWFKQTIVNPQASLSQDRRGTLTLPLIRSIMRSSYPHEKTRAHFHSFVKEKPAGSWPTSPNCELSFKNPYKLYGSMMFESVYSEKRLHLPNGNLVNACFERIDSTLRDKFILFQTVENQLEGYSIDSPLYSLLDKIGINLDAPLQQAIPHQYINGGPSKRIKKQ